jgi:hypothetical protein
MKCILNPHFRIPGMHHQGPGFTQKISKEKNRRDSP